MMFPFRFFLLLSLLFSSFVTEALSSVVNEAVFFPNTQGVGKPGSNYGKSVDVYNNTAVVGSPFASGGGAAYVLEFDGQKWTNIQTLQAIDMENSGSFGFSVSIYENRIIVGARRSTNDKNTTSSGAAYVFTNTSGVWTQTSKIIVPTENTYLFGHSVDLYDSRLIIGSIHDKSTSYIKGAAYIYDYDGNNWSLTQKLTANEGMVYNNFGYSVSLSNDRALIGAIDDGEGETRHGLAYVFDLISGSWQQTHKLKPDTQTNNDDFGYSVDLVNNTAVIGSIKDDTLYENAGAAYVFDFDNNKWNQTSKLLALDGAIDDFFGGSVSLSGDRLVIGAIQGERTSPPSLSEGDSVNIGSAYIYELENEIWVQVEKLSPSINNYSASFGGAVAIFDDNIVIGDEHYTYTNITENGIGAVYFYKFDGTNWEHINRIMADDAENLDNFGNAISISENRIAIAAASDRTNEVSGAVYIFDYINGSWTQSTKLRAFDGEPGDVFGKSISLLGDKLLIGAPKDDDNGIGSGSVYFYKLLNGTWEYQSKLTANDGSPGDWFGYSVKISNNKAVIGALKSDTTNINSGAAYVFDFNGTSWNQSAKIKANDADVSDGFGKSIDIDDNRIVVGSYLDDDNGVDSGSVYVFENNSNLWTQTAKINISEMEGNNWFGFSLSLEANKLLIGSPLDNNNGNAEPAAYMFEYNTNSWDLSKKLLPSSNRSYVFGYSVAVDNNSAVVGSLFSDATIYKLESNVWQEYALTEGVGRYFYGYSVDLSNNRFVVGDITANFSGFSSGVAYVYNLGESYSLGGTISGLASGNSVKINNNNLLTDEIISNNGQFQFDNELINEATYSLEIVGQPFSPNQICSITNAVGTINSADVTNIEINCVIVQYGLSVEVTGLANGNSLVVTLNNESLVVNSNGSYSFINSIEDGSEYEVLLFKQSSNDQVCYMADNSNGSINGYDVTVNIVCKNKYSVGGYISGLATGNVVTLLLNNEEVLTENNGNYTFNNPLVDDSVYAVSIQSQPTYPGQTCVVLNSSGIIDGFDIDNIMVNCTTNKYYIGGSVLGLYPSNTLHLQNRGDKVFINNSTTFVFPEPIDDLDTYHVYSSSNPNNPYQTCSIINNNGQINASDVTDIIVICELGDDYVFGNGFE